MSEKLSSVETRSMKKEMTYKEEGEEGASSTACISVSLFQKYLAVRKSRQPGEGFARCHRLPSKMLAVIFKWIERVPGYEEMPRFLKHKGREYTLDLGRGGKLTLTEHGAAVDAQGEKKSWAVALYSRLAIVPRTGTGAPSAVAAAAARSPRPPQQVSFSAPSSAGKADDDLCVDYPRAGECLAVRLKFTKSSPGRGTWRTCYLPGIFTEVLEGVLLKYDQRLPVAVTYKGRNYILSRGASAWDVTLTRREDGAQWHTAVYARVRDASFFGRAVPSLPPPPLPPPPLPPPPLPPPSTPPAPLRKQPLQPQPLIVTTQAHRCAHATKAIQSSHQPALFPHGIIGFYHPDKPSPIDVVCQAGYLGNFWVGSARIPMQYPDNKGRTYTFTNAEAAFQASKFVADDHAMARFQGATGTQAFQLKRTQTPNKGGGGPPRYGGFSNNLQAMFAVLQSKFDACPELKACLLSTGEAFLLEHNEVAGRDWIWSDNMDGFGLNMLGLQLMQLRDRYRHNQSKPPTRWFRIAGYGDAIAKGSAVKISVVDSRGSPRDEYVPALNDKEWSDMVFFAAEACNAAIGP
jgi:predicted NAD-dependent protein-ADP-ribosyltransferase YbiA (DUF1768 family)